MCGVLYLMRCSLNGLSLGTIYYSLIYSHISYCISIWGGTWACHLKPVITAQKRFLRLISYSPRYERSLPLFVNQRILRFDYIFNYFSGLIIFKFINFNYCRDIFLLARNNNYDLRNNDNNMLVPFFRTCRGQRSILYTAPTIWNNLPNQLKCLRNINSFKQLYKRYLLQAQCNELE